MRNELRLLIERQVMAGSLPVMWPSDGVVHLQFDEFPQIGILEVEISHKPVSLKWIDPRIVKVVF